MSRMFFGSPVSSGPVSKPMSEHFRSCGCHLDRRRFLALAGGTGIMAAMPSAVIAQASEEVETLLLICNEPRVWQNANNYMKTRDLAGKYQPVEVDGAAIGLVAEQYQASRKAFWDTVM